MAEDLQTPTPASHLTCSPAVQPQADDLASLCLHVVICKRAPSMGEAGNDAQGGASGRFSDCDGVGRCWPDGPQHLSGLTAREPSLSTLLPSGWAARGGLQVVGTVTGWWLLQHPHTSAAPGPPSLAVL